jgi:hypothetical protein
MDTPYKLSKKKIKNDIKNIKECQTLDKKHKEITKNFQTNKECVNEHITNIEKINEEIDKMDEFRDKFTNIELTKRAELIKKKDELNDKINDVKYNEMDYYDKNGDLIVQYYEKKNGSIDKKTINIMDFLNGKQQENQNENNISKIFEEYWKRVEGVRINCDDGTKRIKYCDECNVEKILDYGVSAYVCQCCGDLEEVILDEDRKIKNYSPYRKINHFREWLNQFQAKESPEIDEEVYKNIIIELNKNRITDYSELNKKSMKAILKKLGHNSYYEHIHYIINKLSNLPPPKITRDMEKIFIKMFIKIEEPWEMFKKPDRKNFLSYSYVLYKFCELLELDHLLECFTLHQDPNILAVNDEIWEKICKYLKWEFISSFK